MLHLRLYKPSLDDGEDDVTDAETSQLDKEPVEAFVTVLDFLPYLLIGISWSAILWFAAAFVVP